MIFSSHCYRKTITTDLLHNIEGGVFVSNTVLFPVIDLAATGRTIERCRKEAGLSVRDVQNYFGFEYPQAVYKWQHGECLPSVDNLLALAKFLQVRMEDLLVYEDQEVPLFLCIKKQPPLPAEVCVTVHAVSRCSDEPFLTRAGFRLGSLHSGRSSARAACGSWA